MREQIEALAESNGIEPEYQLPDTSETEYLILALSEIGECKMNGGTLTSINWIDIKAWIDVTGAEITAGEAEAIRELSAVYVSQYHKSIEKGCLSPNIERPKNRDAIASKMKSLFAMLRK